MIPRFRVQCYSSVVTRGYAFIVATAALLAIRVIAPTPALAQPIAVSPDAPAANGAYLTSAYAAHSNTGGILEAIQACHRAGGYGCLVIQSADLVISSSQVIDLSAGGTDSLPVLIDGGGHAISCTNPQGVCLTFDGGTRSPVGGHTRQFIWRNFTVNGAGSAGSGILIANMTVGPIIQGRIEHFASSSNSAQALTLSNVEDGQIAVTLLSNFNGLLVRNASNNNEILAWIDVGGDQFKKDARGVALQVQGSSPGVIGSAGNTFRGLVQSNWGTETVIIGQDSAGNLFENMWFENNGDGTARTRLVTFNSSPGHYIVNTHFESCQLISGEWGKLGSMFTTAYIATLGYVTLENNYSIGYASFADATLASLGKFLGINENDTIPGSPAFYGTSMSHAGIKTPGLTITGAPPKTGAGQIGYGGTVVPASFCGSLKGSAGCIVVNVNGKDQYLPYW
jgi:hypothetical protein